MSTGQVGPAPGDGSALHRVAMWLGHYAYLLVLLQCSFVAVTRSVEELVPLHRALRFALDFVSSGLSVAVMMAVLYEVFVHDRQLCFREITAAPLDDPERAVRARRRELRLWHAAGTRLALACCALGGAVVYVIGLNHWLPVPWPLVLLSAALVAVVGYLAWVQGVHRRLAPWCPICRRRYGDDDYDEPPPEPVPSGSRLAWRWPGIPR